jgi:hypothetical protein
LICAASRESRREWLNNNSSVSIHAASREDVTLPGGVSHKLVSKKSIRNKFQDVSTQIGVPALCYMNGAVNAEVNVEQLAGVQPHEAIKAASQPSTDTYIDGNSDSCDPDDRNYLSSDDDAVEHSLSATEEGVNCDVNVFLMEMAG